MTSKRLEHGKRPSLNPASSPWRYPTGGVVGVGGGRGPVNPLPFWAFRRKRDWGYSAQKEGQRVVLLLKFKCEYRPDKGGLAENGDDILDNTSRVISIKLKEANKLNHPCFYDNHLVALVVCK